MSHKRNRKPEKKLTRNQPARQRGSGSAAATQKVAEASSQADRVDSRSAPSEIKAFLFRHGWWLTLLFLSAYLFSFMVRPLPSLQNAADPDLKISRVLLFFLAITADFKEFWESWLSDGPVSHSLLERGTVLFVAGFVTLLAWIPGRLLIVALSSCHQFGRFERHGYSLVFGWQLNSVVIVLLGLMGRLGLTSILIGQLALFVLLGAWAGISKMLLRRRDRDCDIGSDEPSILCQPSNSDENNSARIRRLDRLIQTTGRIFVVGLATLILLGSMLPSIDFDVLEYHLQVPKEWIQNGQIGAVEHNVYGNMPLGAEVNMLPATAVVATWQSTDAEIPSWWLGAMAGKTVMAIQTLVAALLVGCAAYKWMGKTAGIYASVVYLSTPWVIRAAFVGWNENVLGLYVFATAILCLRWFEDSKRSWRGLVMIGIAIGGAMSVKYTGLLFALAPALLLICAGDWLRNRWFAQSPLQNDSATKRFDIAIMIRSVMLVTAIAMVVGGIWFLKNAVLLGNPTYPLMGDLFDVRTPELNEQWDRAHGVPPNGFTAKRLTQDLDLLLVGSEWLSPILIPLALLGCVQRQRSFRIWVLVLFIVVSVAIWFVMTHRVDRFLVPLIPHLALLAGLAAVRQKTFFWRATVGALMLFGSCYGFMLAASPMGALGDQRFLASWDSLREPRSALQETHEIIDEIAASDKNVLLVGDAIPFDLECDVVYNTCFDLVQWDVIVGETEGQGVADRLEAAEISHVFIDWVEIERYRATYGFNSEISKATINQLIRTGVLKPIAIPLSPNQAQLFEVNRK